MISKINRQDSIAMFPILPIRYWDDKNEEYIAMFPQSFRSCILTTTSKSYNTHIKNIVAQIVTLLNELKTDSLVFQGDLDIAWRYRNHDAKQAKQAQQYLTDLRIGKKFNGALQVYIEELPNFIQHLCWLVRLNAVLPNVYFTDLKQSFFASICQYGNIHLSTSTKQSDTIIKEIINRTSLQYITGSCSNSYSTGSAIKERTLNV